MKSINDWRKEKELEKELNETLGVNLSSVRNVFGGSKSTKVDPQLRTSLRTKILQIAREHPELNPLSLFREIMKVVSMLIWKMSGNTFSTSRFAGGVNRDDQNEWVEMEVLKKIAEDLDPNLTTRALGQKVETDPEIRAALKIAYDHIRSNKDYENMPVDDLLDKMQSALMLLSAEMRTNTASTRQVVNKINNSSGASRSTVSDDNVARVG